MKAEAAKLHWMCELLMHLFSLMEVDSKDEAPLMVEIQLCALLLLWINSHRLRDLQWNWPHLDSAWLDFLNRHHTFSFSFSTIVLWNIISCIKPKTTNYSVTKPNKINHRCFLLAPNQRSPLLLFFVCYADILTP